MRSLKFRLLGIWLLSLVASLAVAGLLIQLDRQSTRALVQRAEAVVARSCDLIDDRYRFFVAGVSGIPPAADDRFRQGLAAAVGIALGRQDGVEGGVWQVGAGPLAYAYPTYEGSGPKTDLPAAERDQIAAVNDQAARDSQVVDRQSVSNAQTLLLRACPLAGPVPPHAADAIALLLVPGNRLSLSGDGTATEHGTVIAIHRIGSSQHDMREIEAKPKKGKPKHPPVHGKHHGRGHDGQPGV